MSNCAKPLQVALNYLFKNILFHLSFMLHILFGKFHKILQVFTMCLGLHIDFQIFMWHWKFSPENISFYHNSAQFFEIRKCEKNVDLSFNTLDGSLSSECCPFPSWPLLISPAIWISKSKQSPFAADVIYEVWKLSLKSV